MTVAVSGVTSVRKDGESMGLVGDVKLAAGAMLVLTQEGPVANRLTYNLNPGNVSHNALADLAQGNPHSQYQLRSEKGQALGYAPLDAASRVPAANAPAKSVYSSGGGEAILPADIGAQARAERDIANGYAGLDGAARLLRPAKLIQPDVPSTEAGAIGVNAGNLLFGDGVSTRTVERVDRRGAADGYAPLDASSRVPAAHAPAKSVYASGGDQALAPAELGAEAVSSRGAANGYAPLDGAARVPAGNAPAKSVYSTGGAQALSAGDIGAEASANKNVANGYAGLDGAGMVIRPARLVQPAAPGTGAGEVGVVAGDFHFGDGFATRVVERADRRGAANGYAPLDAASQVPAAHAPAKAVYVAGGAQAVLPSEIGAETSANRGAANGYAPLDGSARVPPANAPPKGVYATGGAQALVPSDIGAESSSNRGAANGYASLDAAAKIPDSQIGGGIARTSNQALTFKKADGTPWVSLETRSDPYFTNRTALVVAAQSARSGAVNAGGDALLTVDNRDNTTDFQVSGIRILTKASVSDTTLGIHGINEGKGDWLFADVLAPFGTGIAVDCAPGATNGEAYQSMLKGQGQLAIHLQTAASSSSSTLLKVEEVAGASNRAAHLVGSTNPPLLLERSGETGIEMRTDGSAVPAAILYRNSDGFFRFRKEGSASEATDRHAFGPARTFLLGSDGPDGEGFRNHWVGAHGIDDANLMFGLRYKVVGGTAQSRRMRMKCEVDFTDVATGVNGGRPLRGLPYLSASGVSGTLRVIPVTLQDAPEGTTWYIPAYSGFA